MEGWSMMVEDITHAQDALKPIASIQSLKELKGISVLIWKVEVRDNQGATLGSYKDSTSQDRALKDIL
tara:strand:- start:879 stop:1082 length:204 start_codon:yes stop_codon:yes gene_type:complete